MLSIALRFLGGERIGGVGTDRALNCSARMITAAHVFSRRLLLTSARAHDPARFAKGLVMDTAFLPLP